MKFVLLEGLEHKNRFFTLNDPNVSEEDMCKLTDGTVAYRVLGYAETVKEAQAKLYQSSEGERTPG